MRLSRTDVFASYAVGVGVLAYAFWLADIAVPGLGSPRAVGAVVLLLGWLASAAAVVPSFADLIHSSRVYLVVTSALGLAALTAGIVVLVNASEPMLALLVLATITMWLMATIRHTLMARRTERPAAAHSAEKREMTGAGR